jgi:hypothetical protein
MKYNSEINTINSESNFKVWISLWRITTKSTIKKCCASHSQHLVFCIPLKVVTQKIFHLYFDYPKSRLNKKRVYLLILTPQAYNIGDSALLSLICRIKVCVPHFYVDSLGFVWAMTNIYPEMMLLSLSWYKSRLDATGVASKDNHILFMKIVQCSCNWFHMLSEMLYFVFFLVEIW